MALADHFSAVTEVGESRTCIRVAGPRARALLQKGCPLDLHSSVFKAGACAQSILAKSGVTLHLFADESAEQAGAEGPVFDIYVLRSFAEYLWAWLEDAGREYGVTILK
jgi:sarcosine oxidase subunit gamma